MTIRKHSCGTGFPYLFIYGDTATLGGFVGGLTVEDPDEVTNMQQQVKGHSRRKYPGDGSPDAVPAHNRITLEGEPAKYAVLPGQNAYFEVESEQGGQTKTDVTTFTFVGTFVDLHAFVLGNASASMVLRSPGGKPWSINVTT